MAKAIGECLFQWGEQGEVRDANVKVLESGFGRANSIDAEREGRRLKIELNPNIGWLLFTLCSPTDVQCERLRPRFGCIKPINKTKGDKVRVRLVEFPPDRLQGQRARWARESPKTFYG